MSVDEGALKHILVADDDPAIVGLLRDFLEAEGFSVSEAHNGKEVLARLDKAKPDVLLMDVRMPDLSGLDILQKVKEQGIDLPVLIMTAFGTSSIAIKAIQLGAFDYIAKPFDLEEVLVTVNRLLDYQALAAEVKTLRVRLGEPDPSERIVGRSLKMMDIYKIVGRVARSEATVLITGETGTGKELVAEVIHYNSNNRHGPLVKVACASLPETLLESELFGHEKGAFTSAYAQRKGRFELAHKGSIFLDEIGEMSLGTQKKLLQVLQEKTFERVGGSTPIHVETRVIAATNKRLADEVAAGRFREDLYYRLNVISIHMPPLRERKDDIPLLVQHFLEKHRLTPASPPARITEEALVKLIDYDWPGNVRELENTIERAVVLSQGGVITNDHLLLSPVTERAMAGLEDMVRQGRRLSDILTEVERRAIEESLRQSAGDRAEAARRLGLDREELEAKLASAGSRAA
ncbi:MAG: sigma-54 dependent transcriptional regulator [Bacteroidetes bacterium]|nr:sigma-54 dependent transcriptional regulator [Bacteroidota bacterium]MCL5025799.1 sigma-54 dependent transcriptional regulator [Chloroflexota bacterium]